MDGNSVWWASDVYVWDREGDKGDWIESGDSYIANCAASSSMFNSPPPAFLFPIPKV